MATIQQTRSNAILGLRKIVSSWNRRWPVPHALRLIRVGLFPACPHQPHVPKAQLYMWKSILAIAVGAALGALLRWQLGIRLNALFPTIPPGTLVANLIGAYVIGLAIAFFASFSALSPEWRLLVITGFCGGLTTFSTFSAELVTLLQQGRVLWALGIVAAHVVGSVLMTIAGMATIVWARIWI